MFNYIIQALSTLKYPNIATIEHKQSIDGNDLVSLISWLENRIIREMNIESRHEIDKPNEKWNETFVIYLQTLGCPFLSFQNNNWLNYTELERFDSILWLLNYAIDLYFADCKLYSILILFQFTYY